MYIYIPGSSKLQVFLCSFWISHHFVSFPWYNIFYDHYRLDISLSHSGYPSTNHHHRPATAAIFSVVQWYSGTVAGCLAGCLAGLLACWLVCLLAWFARWLPCLLACWLAGWLACLLAGSLLCLLACLLAGRLACLLAALLPWHTSLRELSREKRSPGRKKNNPRKNGVPQHTNIGPTWASVGPRWARWLSMGWGPGLARHKTKMGPKMTQPGPDLARHGHNLCPT